VPNTARAAATTLPLVLPPSVTMASGRSVSRMARSTPSVDCTGMARKTRSASRTAAAGSAKARSTTPISSARAQVRALRAEPVISPASCRSRKARAKLEPISPSPMMATLRNRGALMPARS